MTFQEIQSKTSKVLSAPEYIRWLEGVIDAIHDGILVIDAQEIVQHINREYTNITGVSKEQIIGQPLRKVRPGAQLPLTLKDGMYRSGIYRKEGKKEYVVDMAPIYQNQEIIGAVSVCKSLSEVHTLAKELQSSKKRLAQLEKTVGHMHQAKYTFKDIIGSSHEINRVIDQAEKVSSFGLNVLITGESGTGKEMFAQAIHLESPRRNQPFVAVNCAAIPHSLLESELFGYEEGAFTHSKHGGKMGLFELAHTGTLFLDEIGEMSNELQAKLLRVLQEGLIRKIGGLTEQKIDVRIIAATNKDLSTMVEKHHFRADLYYRLNAVNLTIPALRHRKTDLPELCQYFIKNRNHGLQYQIDDEVIIMLQQYDWPGNIRELKNAIQYSAYMTDEDRIKVEHLPETIRQSITASSIHLSSADSASGLKAIVEQAEYEAIKTTLQRTGFDLHGKKSAARELGISLATLYNKLSQYDIKQLF